MASLREIRNKIKSVKNTQQITRAMKLVAAARVRRAQERILSARPFAERIDGLISEVGGSARGTAGVDSPFFEVRPVRARAFVLFSSDRGLCGAFNTNLIRRTLEQIRTRPEVKTTLYVVGRKGRDYFRRAGVPIAQEWTNLGKDLSYAHAEIIGQELIDQYLRGQVDQVYLIFNEFKSVIQQRLIVRPLLPIERPENPAPGQGEFLYEPRQEVLLQDLIVRHLKAQIYRSLLESGAAELGARMSAMDSATKNAAELIDVMTIRSNRTRQAAITKEILEVMSGAESFR